MDTRVTHNVDVIRTSPQFVDGFPVLTFNGWLKLNGLLREVRKTIRFLRFRKIFAPERRVVVIYY